MSLSLIPAFTPAASAEETQTTKEEKNITFGTAALKGSQASNVYFGNYQQSSLGNRKPSTGTEGVDWIKSDTATKNDQGPYYKIEPIKWRVLSNVNGKALLLSDKNIDLVQYNTEQVDVTWETSTVRSWLNGYGTTFNAQKIDFSSDNFIGFAFSKNEKTLSLQPRSSTQLMTEQAEQIPIRSMILRVEMIPMTKYFYCLMLRLAIRITVF